MENTNVNNDYILMLNIQSILAHKDDVDNLIQKLTPTVLCLTETRVTKEIEDSEVNIDNYNLVRCDSSSRHTGGVLIYIKKNVRVDKCDIHVSDYEYWSATINFKISKEIITLHVIYRSPSSSVANFLDYFEKWCSEISEVNNNVIIMGDFNINWNNMNLYTDKLKRIVNMQGMKQLVKENTRITNFAQTSIDLVISNIFDLDVQVLRSPKITDHDIINVQLPYNSSINKTNFKLQRRNVDFNKIEVELLDKNWLYENSNINVVYDNFVENIVNILDKNAPKQMVECKSKTSPWYNYGNLTQARKNRDKAYKKFCFTQSANDWSIYKSLRNTYTSIFRITKKKYFEQTIDDCKHDSAKMWKTLKHIISANTKNNVTEIEFDDRLEDKECIIAEKFNEYFISSVDDIVNSIAHCTQHFENNMIESAKFDVFEPLTLNGLRNIVFNQKCNKACSDELDWKLLRNLFNTIGYPLLNIINMSLKNGVIPDKLKISTVSPIPKINNTIKACEFRPINILPVIDKILEIAVKNQLVEYLNKAEILVNEQSGFREKHSCETALQLIISEWKEAVDNREMILATFLDLKRAFETIDRDKLIKKLEMYGMKGIVLKWFTNYLENRKQITKFISSTSSLRGCNKGIPQGSVLGPILFILYINDLPQILNYCKIHLFADDALIYIKSNCYNHLFEGMNLDLDMVYKWLCTNKLKLNCEKTKCMLICKKRDIRSNNLYISIGNQKIVFVDEIKYLGIILDCKLNFNNHINFIIKKIAKKINFMSRVSKSLSLDSKILIYNSIVLPHFYYCSSILFLINNECIQKLQVLQNRAMRVILNANRYTSISSMLNALQWLCVKDLIFMQTMVFIFKIVCNKLPQYLCTKIIRNSSIHSYSTRNKENVYLPKVNSTAAQNSLFIKGMSLYNSLNQDIKNAETVLIFKKKLTAHLLSVNK